MLAAARSSWIEYESADDLNVNLDGEPVVTKRFRVECRQRALPVRLGEGALLSSSERVAAQREGPAVLVPPSRGEG
jgi:hypothetical protein